MSRLSDHNVVVAKEIIARYPKKKSALIPLVHLSQQQNGYVTEDAMRHIAELLDAGAALSTFEDYELSSGNLASLLDEGSPSLAGFHSS